MFTEGVAPSELKKNVAKFKSKSRTQYADMFTLSHSVRDLQLISNITFGTAVNKNLTQFRIPNSEDKTLHCSTQRLLTYAALCEWFYNWRVYSRCAMYL